MAEEKALIGIEDFLKVDLRVAKVLSAERVEGSEKLLKLQISLGDEERTIVAGIAKHYSPEELVGKKIVIVANLKPRKIFGITSQGMLLAASDGENLSLIVPDRDVKEGAKLS
ncbi:methionine--tRNA ligase subunit beta [Aquifex sp.]